MVKPKAKSASSKNAHKSPKPAPAKPRRGAATKAGAAHPAGGKPAQPGANGHPAAPPLTAENPLAMAQQNLGTIKSSSGVELTEKIKELLRLAQEQGYLTYNDINDALPDNIVSAIS